MKALAKICEGKVDLVELPEPEIRPNAVKIKVEYCALCATDIHIVTHDLYHFPKEWLPLGLGHEGAGTIIELSAEAAAMGYEIGDKVAVASLGHCGVCDECKRGNDVFCENSTSAMPMAAEYAVINLDMIFKIPEGGDPLQYCIAEPCASAMRGIDIADIKVGDSVLISGVGGIGAILLDMLTKRGVTRLTASDPLPQKRQRALEMGAQFVIDPSSEDIVAEGMKITDNRGYDIIIEASGVPAAAPPMLKLVANKGKVVYFAVFPMDYELPVNLYDMYMKEASIRTVYTTIYNYPRVIDLLPQMQVDKIIGPVMPLDDAAEAFELYKKSEYPKIVIKCSDEA